MDDRTEIGELYDVLHECENDHKFTLTLYEYHWESRPKEHMYDYIGMGIEACTVCGTKNFHRLESPSSENSRTHKKKLQEAAYHKMLVELNKVEKKARMKKIMLRAAACL